MCYNPRVWVLSETHTHTVTENAVNARSNDFYLQTGARSHSPVGSRPRRRVQNKASGRGGPWEPNKPRGSSGHLRRVAEGRRRARTPGLPVSPHPAVRASPFRSRAGRRCHQQLPTCSESPRTRNSRHNSLEERTVNPPAKWRDEDESVRLRLLGHSLSFAPNAQSCRHQLRDFLKHTKEDRRRLLRRERRDKRLQ